MTAIVPTVGRVVWYRPNEHDARALHSDGKQPLAAHVAYVHSVGMVNLMVIDALGNPHSRTSVALVQHDETPAHGSSYCEWMPYQQGQAAKAEKAESDLAEVRKLASAGASGSSY